MFDTLSQISEIKKMIVGYRQNNHFPKMGIIVGNDLRTTLSTIIEHEKLN